MAWPAAISREIPRQSENVVVNLALKCDPQKVLTIPVGTVGYYLSVVSFELYSLLSARSIYNVMRCN